MAEFAQAGEGTLPPAGIVSAARVPRDCSAIA